MFAKSRRSIWMVLAFVVAGCGGGSDAAKEMTPESVSRLDAIGETENLVLSLSMDKVPESLPLLSGRELERHGGELLVEIPKDAFEGFQALSGVKKMAVWGKAANVRKMDHWLQAQVLDSWATGTPPAINCLARFEPGTENLRETLEGMGVQVGTVAGVVVTLDADAKTVLDIVNMPELDSINQPRQMTPSR